MAVMIITTLVLAVLTAIGTLIWWAMMHNWIEKDRKSRGRHHADISTTDSPKSNPGPAPRVIRRDGSSGG